MIQSTRVGEGRIEGPFHRINREGNAIVGGHSGFRLRIEWYLTQEKNTNITLVNVDVFYISSSGFEIVRSDNHRTFLLELRDVNWQLLQNQSASWGNLNANIIGGRNNLLVSRTFTVEHDENGRAPGSVWVPDEIEFNESTGEETIIKHGYWNDGIINITSIFGVRVQNLVGNVSIIQANNGVLVPVSGQMVPTNTEIRIPNIEVASNIAPRMPDFETGATNTRSVRSWIFPNDVDVIIEPKSQEFHHYVDVQIQNDEDRFVNIKRLFYPPGEFSMSTNFTIEENNRIADYLMSSENGIRQSRYVIRTYSSTGVQLGELLDERQVGEDVITPVGVITLPTPIAVTADRFELNGASTSIPLQMEFTEALSNYENVNIRMQFQIQSENGHWDGLGIADLTTPQESLINTAINNAITAQMTDRMSAHIRIITTTRYNAITISEPFESNPIECFYDLDNVRPIAGVAPPTATSNTNGIITVQIPTASFTARLGASMERVTASAEGVTANSIIYPSGSGQIVFPHRPANGGSQSVFITAFDSRGNFLTREITVNVQGFGAPAVFGVAERIGETNEVRIGCHGTCLNDKSSHIDVLYRYKIEGQNWTVPMKMKCKEMRNNKWVSDKNIINIPLNKNAEFQFMAKDSNDGEQEWGESKSIQVFSNTPAFHINASRNIVSVGQLPHTNTALNNGIHSRVLFIGNGTGQGVHNANSNTGPRIVLANNDGASNDWAVIRCGGGTNTGELVFETHDDGNEPIIFRQINSSAGTSTRTLTLMNGSGNAIFPGTITATTFIGALNGNATTASTASAVAWGNITSRPTTFAPSAHNHDAGNITSGTIPDARMPWLDAAWTNRGTFADARIPSNISRTNHTHTLIDNALRVSSDLRIGAAANASGGRLAISGGHLLVQCPNPGASRVRITAAGTTTTWRSVEASSFIQSSSSKYKENISNPTNIGLEVINNMNVVEYYYKEDGSEYRSFIERESHLGLIAEDNNDVTTVEHDGVYLDKVIWNNVVALQQLNKKNKRLKKDNEELQIKLNNIESLLINIIKKLEEK